ncbi:hypothetical protein OY671_009818, partial [Metschnikowia pulcherrima]
QDIAWQISRAWSRRPVGVDRVHGSRPDEWLRDVHRDPGHRAKAATPVPGWNPSQISSFRSCTFEHKSTGTCVTLSPSSEESMTRQPATAANDSRPFNNSLRRFNDADFALVEPSLERVDAKADELLYNPGDNVETVHFPCGPSLASFLVANEDGRDVETILVGREGAVGGIVSQGYSPA